MLCDEFLLPVESDSLTFSFVESDPLAFAFVESDSLTFSFVESDPLAFSFVESDSLTFAFVESDSLTFAFSTSFTSLGLSSESSLDSVDVLEGSPLEGLAVVELVVGPFLLVEVECVVAVFLVLAIRSESKSSLARPEAMSLYALKKPVSTR